MITRTICRTIVFNTATEKILLVRNRDTNFWYPPGGGLEEYDESLRSCGEREVYEEVGVEVIVNQLVYIQELILSSEKRSLEFFWLSRVDSLDINLTHKDLDPNGLVEECRWFGRDDIQEIAIYPIQIKNDFWEQERYKGGSGTCFIYEKK